MNWHNHCGIYTYLFKKQLKIILVYFMREHDYMYRVGMPYDDYVESPKNIENSLRGYEWYNFTDEFTKIRL